MTETAGEPRGSNDRKKEATPGLPSAILKATLQKNRRRVLDTSRIPQLHIQRTKNQENI